MKSKTENMGVFLLSKAAVSLQEDNMNYCSRKKQQTNYTCSLIASLFFSSLIPSLRSTISFIFNFEFHLVPIGIRSGCHRIFIANI